MSAVLADLLAALAGAPYLPDAACKGMPAPFDPPGVGEPARDVEHRHRVALRICADCPALRLCTNWIAALPPADRPGGVVAGQVLPQLTARRRTTPRQASPNRPDRPAVIGA